MSIELSKETKAQAITSIKRYFNENMEQRIGNVAAGALLTFFPEEDGLYGTSIQDPAPTRRTPR